MTRIEIMGWVKSGAPLHEGVRLFALVAGDIHPFLRLLQSDHAHNYPILLAELCRRFEVDPASIPPQTFREHWKFLSEPTCPPELKILASDKISAYHRYCRAHELLFDCVTAEEQHATVKTLVKSYMENRLIIEEFKYYQQHGHTLRKHPIFAQLVEIESLRKLSPIELVKFQSKLQHNIWRIESELKKSISKPHLRSEREERLKFKKMQLAEVDRLLERLN